MSNSVNKTESSNQALEQADVLHVHGIHNWSTASVSTHMVASVPQLVAGSRMVHQAKLPARTIAVGMMASQQPSPALISSVQVASFPHVTNDNTNVLAKVLTSTTLDTARASLHQSQGTAALLSMPSKLNLRGATIPAIGTHLGSQSSAMLHGSLGGILTSMPQMTLPATSIIRGSIGSVSVSTTVTSVTFSSLSLPTVSTVNRTPTVSMSSFQANLQTHILPRGVAVAQSGQPVTVKPGIVTQTVVRMPVSHPATAQARIINPVRPVSSVGVVVPAANSELARMTVPVKEGMARVPLITKSSQQLQLTAVTQNTSLGSVAGTKPGIITLPTPSVNKFPKNMIQQPITGVLAGNVPGIGRQQVAASQGARTQKFVFAPSTVAGAQPSTMLRTVTPGGGPINLSQTPAVRPQRNIVTLPGTVASVTPSKPALISTVSTINPTISVSAALISSIALAAKTQQVHKPKVAVTGQLVSVVMTASVGQAHATNSFNMQLPAVANLATGLPVQASSVALSHIAGIVTSTDNIPVPAVLASPVSGLQVPTLARSSTDSKLTDRSHLYSVTTSNESSQFYNLSSDLHPQSRTYGNTVLVPSPVRSAELHSQTSNVSVCVNQPVTRITSVGHDSILPLTAADHKVELPIVSAVSNGSLTSPGAQRPSILRKRAAEGMPVVRKTTLQSSQDPHISSTTEVAISSPKSSVIDPSRENSQSSTDTASSTESTPAKIKLEHMDVLDNSNDIASVVASPRKKPRKQLLNASEELKDTVQSDEEIRKFAKRIRQLREVDRLTEEAVHKEAEEYVDEEGIHWVTEKKHAPVSLLSFYQCSWNSLANHFQRYSDVKQKDERRPTVNEIANQKGINQRASGWKLYHLAAQLEDLMEMELEVSSRLLIGHETLLPKRVKHNLQDDDISSSVHELTQGNVQRSKLLVEQLREARSCMLKVLDHLPRVTDVISKHHSKRPVKKKERI